MTRVQFAYSRYFFLSLTFIFLISTAYTQISSNNCGPTPFFRIYSGTPELPYIEQITPAKDGAAMVGGPIIDTVNNNYDDGFVAKIDTAGNPVWAKKINTPVDIIRLRDGNYLSIGSADDPLIQSFTVQKFDEDGSTIWKKVFGVNNIDNFFLYRVSEADDSTIMIVGVLDEKGINVGEKTFILNLDNNGTLRWSKTYYRSTTFFSGNIDTYSIGNYTYVSGLRLLLDAGAFGAMMKIETQTGRLIFNKRYSYNDGESRFFHAFKYNASTLCMLGSTGVNQTDTTFMMMIDTTGKSTSTTYFQFNSGQSRNGTSASMTAGGSFVYTCEFARPSPQVPSFAVIHVNPSSGIISASNYTTLVNSYMGTDAMTATDGATWHTGLRTIYLTSHSYIARFNGAQQVHCEHEPVDVHFGKAMGMDIDVPMIVEDRFFTVLPVFKKASNTQILVIEKECETAADCKVVLSGPARVCAGTNKVLFEAARGANCTNKIQWQTNCADLASASYPNDTTIAITFSKNWSGYVYALIQSTCGILRDSIYVTVTGNTAPVKIHGGTSFCEGDSLMLSADSGYTLYDWSTGAKTQAITVKKAGKYWMKVSDGCGNVSADTLNVIMFKSAALNWQRQYDLCKGDTLALTIPAGLNAQQWTPANNISNPGSNKLLFTPTVYTQYHFQANDANGCKVYDSLRVQVFIPLPIGLPADRSICKGDTIFLQVPQYFKSLRWNDGDITSMRQLTLPAQYSIQAIDSNGCVARDSFKIISYFPIPSPSLPQNKSLCEHQTLQLNASPGMASYKWNTGATTAQLAVFTRGNYAVIMQTMDGCTWHDTATITSVNPLPGNFLPASLSLCQYESKSVEAANEFKSYLWSNQATTRSIMIGQTGLYWLTVTDNNGCIRSDTLIVIQGTGCINGVYIPSAFTPNNDGKNDVFKAIIGQPVEHFVLRIYNRFGGLVFESTDPTKAWNGKLQYLEQPVGAYVWKLVYNNAGENSVTRSGTVMLLR